MLTQTLSITPNGLIRGGEVDYSADPVTGLTQYHYLVNLPLWQKQEKKDFYSVPPQDLLSTVFQKVGDELKFGPLTFTATSVAPGETDVNLELPGILTPGKSSAKIDTTGQYIKVKSLLALGSYSGVGFTALLTPTAPLKLAWLWRHLFKYH